MSQIRTADLQEIMFMVWGAYLNMPLESAFALQGNGQFTESYFCAILITGERKWLITLQYPEKFANIMVEKLIRKPEDRVVPGEEIEAVAELGNLVAGNLKTLFPSPCKLSLPIVQKSHLFNFSIPDSILHTRQSYLCNEHQILLEVWEQNVAPSS